MLLLGLIWTPLAMCLAGVGLWALARDRRFKAELIRTSGRVVETLAVDDEGSTRYQPRVEYRVPGVEEALHATDESTFDRVYWQLGDERVVHYDPAAPGTALVSMDTRARTFGGMFLLMGVLFTLMGAFFIAAGVLGPQHPFVRAGSQLFGPPD